MARSRMFWFLILLLVAIAGMAWHAAGRSAPEPGPVKTEDWSATSTSGSTPVPADPRPTGSALAQKVSMETPKQGSIVPHTFYIGGKAPGNWYFEASFPIIVTDADGNKLTATHAQAQSDWMTTELVAYTAKIDVGSYSGPIVVNLLKDNPSGLPENDDSTSFELVVQ